MYVLKVRIIYAILFILFSWSIALLIFGIKGLAHKKTFILSFLTHWFTREVEGKYALFWSWIYLVSGIILLVISFSALSLSHFGKIMDPDKTSTEEARDGSTTKQNITLSPENCHDIVSANSNKYTYCESASDGNVKRIYGIFRGEGLEDLNYIETFLVSPDNKKAFIAKLNPAEIPDAYEPIGGAFSPDILMVNLETGGLYPLGERIVEFSVYISPERSIFDSKYKITGKETPWSPDGQGIILHSYEGIIYCAETCKTIVKPLLVGFEGTPAPFFLGNKLYYEESENKSPDFPIIWRSIEWEP